MDCSYLVQVPSGNIVALSFTHFDLERKGCVGCVYDYIEIFDGNQSDATKIGRFCGSNKPTPIRSSTNELFLKFVTDSSITRSGFVASYTAEYNDKWTLAPMTTEGTKVTHGEEDEYVITTGRGESSPTPTSDTTTTEELSLQGDEESEFRNSD